ncbi:MAG: hypothetical protein KC646_00995 [Candidatus Cloacimonetes bacterium]|nr:hypothetical protein [Candidatus Cloacimonadota bacterium]
MKYNYYAAVAAFLITFSYFILAMQFDNQVSKIDIHNNHSKKKINSSKTQPINLLQMNHSLLQHIAFTQINITTNSPKFNLLSSGPKPSLLISSKDNLDEIDQQVSSIESTLFTTINQYELQLSKVHLSEIQNYIFQMNSSLTALYIIQKDLSSTSDLDDYKSVLIRLDQAIQSFQKYNFPNDFMILLESFNFKPQLESLSSLVFSLKNSN